MDSQMHIHTQTIRLLNASYVYLFVFFKEEQVDSRGRVTSVARQLNRSPQFHVINNRYWQRMFEPPSTVWYVALKLWRLCLVSLTNRMIMLLPVLT